MGAGALEPSAPADDWTSYRVFAATDRHLQ